MDDSDPVLSFHFVSLQCSYLILPSKTLSSPFMNLWTWPALSSLHACSERSLQLRVLAITESLLGLPGGPSGKELACQGRRHKRCEFNLLEMEMVTQSSILSHGQRSLQGYSPRGCKDSDVT